ncbi:MAG: type II secretion system protein [Ignavibacteriales bacterium]|nr:type II secretion system protein [Ignavibacteriales bacterium]
MMHCEQGYTIMEALVSIVLIGLLITLSLVFFNMLFNSPLMGKKSEALLLAKNEMEYCLHSIGLNDTSYSNRYGTIRIDRNCQKTDSLIIFTVKAILLKNNKQIVEFYASRKE